MSESEKRQFNTTTQTNWDEPPAGAEYWRGRCRDCHHLLSEHEPSWACYVPAATGFTIDGPAVEQAVPVAWRIRRPPRTIWDVCQLRTAYARNHWQRKGYEVEPLYTHPPATDEALGTQEPDGTT